MPLFAYSAGCPTIYYDSEKISPSLFIDLPADGAVELHIAFCPRVRTTSNDTLGESCLANALALLNVIYQTPTSTCTISLKTYKCILFFLRYIFHFNLVLLQWCSSSSFQCTKGSWSLIVILACLVQYKTKCCAWEHEQFTLTYPLILPSDFFSSSKHHCGGDMLSVTAGRIIFLCTELCLSPAVFSISRGQSEKEKERLRLDKSRMCQTGISLVPKHLLLLLLLCTESEWDVLGTCTPLELNEWNVCGGRVERVPVTSKEMRRERSSVDPRGTRRRLH